jgi:protease YdgD
MRHGNSTSGWFAVLSVVGALLVMQSASPAELPLLPGIGAVDRRLAVDLTKQPWDAIAKVQTNIGTRCTGALITPSTVLTAAHCLYNSRTRALLQAGSIHVLLGYNRGDYRWHRMVERYTVGQGFDGSKAGLQGSDWARLELDGAIPDLIAPLPIAIEPPLSGVAIVLAGYNQDRAQVLMADLSCHITGTAMAAGKPFIAHDCDATRGTSGGPLLVRQGGDWAVIGINLGAAPGANLALSATAFGN